MQGAQQAGGKVYVRQVVAQQVRPGHVVGAGTAHAGRVAYVVQGMARARWWAPRQAWVWAYCKRGRVVGSWPAGALVRVAWWPAQN